MTNPNHWNRVASNEIANGHRPQNTNNMDAKSRQDYLAARAHQEKLAQSKQKS